MCLSKEKTLIGRNPGNDVVLKEPFISRKHCAIRREGADFFLEDLTSSNGTFVNGVRISETVRLRNNDTISFGGESPVLRFRIHQERLMTAWDFIRRRPLWISLGAAGAALVLIGILLRPLIFRPRSPDAGGIAQGLRSLERVHGAEIFPDDPAFLTAVGKWMVKVKGDEAFQSTLESRIEYQGMIEGILTASNLSVDYSLIVWAESRYNPGARNSRTGAAGLWQFVPRTARAYGLHVDRVLDERMDPLRSTQAAALYLKDLVSIFGRDSFLLVLAAFNAGDNAVLYGLKQIQDPVKDRNFWYLYTHNLIPAETKEYVLKIIALAILSQDL